MTVMELSKPLDYHLSPITGYTREHWCEIAERIVAGFLPYVNADTGIVELPPDVRDRKSVV